MQAHGLLQHVRANVISPARALVRSKIATAKGAAPFSAQTSSRTPRSLPSSSSIILPHEELKIKLARAHQEKAAKVKRNAKLSHNHHDLASYMQAHRLRLSLCDGDEQKMHALNTNYVHLGTRYEYLVQKHLSQELGFLTTQVGGKGDGGVDLIGTWTLPKTADQRPRGKSATFRVYIQAKRYAPHRKPMPSLMREVEGTLMSAPDSPLLKEAFANHLARVGTELQNLEFCSLEEGQSTDDTKSEDLEDLGILITTLPFPTGIEKAMKNSRRCLMYIQLEEWPFQMPEKNSKTVQEIVNELGDAQDLQSRLRKFTQNSTIQITTNVPKTKICQIVWNEAATKAGLVGYDVVTQHDSSAASDDSGHERAMLVYQQTALQL